MLPSPILSSSANSTFCFALFCFVLFPLFCSPSSCILIPCSELLCSLAKHQALFCQDIPHVIPALARWKSHILNAAKVSFAFQRKSGRIFHERVKAFPRLNQPNLGWRSWAVCHLSPRQSLPHHPRFWAVWPISITFERRVDGSKTIMLLEIVLPGRGALAERWKGTSLTARGQPARWRAASWGRSGIWVLVLGCLVGRKSTHGQESRLCLLCCSPAACWNLTIDLFKCKQVNRTKQTLNTFSHTNKFSGTMHCKIKQKNSSRTSWELLTEVGSDGPVPGNTSAKWARPGVEIGHNSSHFQLLRVPGTNVLFGCIASLLCLLPTWKSLLCQWVPLAVVRSMALVEVSAAWEHCCSYAHIFWMLGALIQKGTLI